LQGYQTTPTPILVTEYCEGGNLKDYLSRKDVNWKLSTSIELLYEAAAGMAHAHDREKIHCDLKAENILVDIIKGQPLAKVADFGLAKARKKIQKDSGNHTHRFVGIDGYATWAYAPPEFFAKVDLDKASDVWSFGMMCYQVMSKGQAPFRRSDDVSWLSTRRYQPNAHSSNFLANSFRDPSWRIAEQTFWDPRPVVESYAPLLEPGDGATAGHD
jgi:serine/threonine protein kinase